MAKLLKPLGALASRFRGDIARLASRARAAIPGLAKRGSGAVDDVGLSARGLRPAPGTRVRPEGIPEGRRIRGTTKTPGGTEYYDPTNLGNRVRVMQGDPTSPWPTSRAPYVRWQAHGPPLDVHGNKLPTSQLPEAHIPLEDFRFDLGPFQ
ncbi:MAG: hypothetical protein DCC49_13095 [Acidobacteria bacterium]|nr:MAG: hypothetical protein DCC49_13095 [Acidobacteriota bacterium]